jgi:type IX secretion system PorP/SprF family membrane protein
MKIIKRIFLFSFTALLLWFSGNISAQQISLFDHYFYNPIINNPAFTGNKETTNIMLLNRTQWTGFKGAPKLNALSIDGNIFNEKMGLGAIIFSDSKGINKTIGGNLLYSYRVNLSEVSHLNFGVTFRFISHTMNFSDATVENVSDPTLFNSQQSRTNFNGDLGLAYFWKNLEIGVATDQILANETSYFNEAGNDISYTPTYHFINSIKYTFQINKEKQIKLAPQALVRYIENTPLQYEINTNLYYKNMFWVGAAYKNDYAVSANAGISLLNKFDIGYSYTFVTTDIGQQAGMSHEIMLNFKFGKKEKKEKIEEEEEKPIEEEIPKEEENKTEEENGIRIIRANTDDFETPQFETPKPGVYVIVGTFSYRELADKYAIKVKNKGFNQTSFIYSQDDNFNYVYIFLEQSKKDALNKIEEARENGSKTAWILILTE